MAENKKIYPELIIKNNEHPSRLLAFPFLGIIIKTILLIPVFIEGFFLVFALIFYWMITPFVILFTGKYWNAAFDFSLGYYKFNTKVVLYISGLTDKYPGFELDDNGIFTLKINKPKSPNRVLAFPLLGYLVRVILLIPYLVFSSVLSYGEIIAVFFSWFIVLFTSKYPESIYEFVSDTRRVALAQSMYIFYLSDTYPSFYISMKHKTIKILLIIAGALLLLSRTNQAIKNVQNRNSQRYNRFQNNKYYYQNQQNEFPGK